jgi:hypothetical protein
MQPIPHVSTTRSKILVLVEIYLKTDEDDVDDGDDEDGSEKEANKANEANEADDDDDDDDDDDEEDNNDNVEEEDEVQHCTWTLLCQAGDTLPSVSRVI